MSKVRIFGVDPSVRALGWGVIDFMEGNLSCVASDTLYTNPAESMPIRLHKIQKKVSQLIDDYAPEVIALETVFLQADLLAILKISYVRGIVMSLAGERLIKVVEITPTSVKKCLTGNGRSGKDRVREMLVHVLGLQKNKHKFSSFDESDSLAIAYCAAIGLGQEF